MSAFAARAESAPRDRSMRIRRRYCRPRRSGRRRPRSAPQHTSGRRRSTKLPRVLRPVMTSGASHSGYAPSPGRSAPGSAPSSRRRSLCAARSSFRNSAMYFSHSARASAVGSSHSVFATTGIPALRITGSDGARRAARHEERWPIRDTTSSTSMTDTGANSRDRCRSSPAVTIASPVRCLRLRRRRSAHRGVRDRPAAAGAWSTTNRAM